jgi:hypothetical protein
MTSTRLIGHVLRIMGILIEMLGVWGVYTAAQGGNVPKVPVRSGESVPIAWVAVGLGFALWLVGMVTLTVARKPRARRDHDDQELQG